MECNVVESFVMITGDKRKHRLFSDENESNQKKTRPINDCRKKLFGTPSPERTMLDQTSPLSVRCTHLSKENIKPLASNIKNSHLQANQSRTDRPLPLFEDCVTQQMESVLAPVDSNWQKYRDTKGQPQCGIAIEHDSPAILWLKKIINQSQMAWCFTGSFALMLWAKKLGVSYHRKPRDLDILISASGEQNKRHKFNENRQKLTKISGLALSNNGKILSTEGASDTSLARIQGENWGDRHVDVLVSGEYGSLDGCEEIFLGYPVASLHQLKRTKEYLLIGMQEDIGIYQPDYVQEQRQDIEFIERLIAIKRSLSKKVTV